MKKLDEVLARLATIGPEAEAAGQEVVDHYETELDQVTQHLSQVYEELMLLYDVGSEIGASLDPNDIADRAIARMHDLFEGSHGVVVLVSPPDQPLVLGSEAYAADGLALVQWATEQAMTKDRSVIANDLADVGAPATPGVHALLSSPLRARGRLIGAVLVVGTGAGSDYSTQDQMLLETIASQIGVSIENSRLFQREQQHARHLTEALDELRSTYDDTLAALSGALDLRDNETEGHARRVTRFAVCIARQLGCDAEAQLDIERGALMHDIGKIGVPDAILLKPGKLTDEEWAVMRTHPVLGWQMIRNIRFLAGAAPVVLHHHERYDGKGYPAQLAGADIPLGARIFAIADTFDAMTSDRPYRKALGYEETYAEVIKCAGSQFDPDVVAAFASVAEGEWAEVRTTVETELALKRRDAMPPLRDMS